MKRRIPVHFERTSHLKFFACLVVVGILTCTGIRSASATEARLVKIEPVIKEGKVVSVKLDPETTIIVPKGTIVVWLSGVQGTLLKLVFDDPAACQDVTADPKLRKLYTHWYDCYTTTYLPYAETTSLQFTQPGDYPYVVRTEDGKRAATGRIIVRAP